MSENEYKAMLTALFRKSGALVLSLHGHAMQQPGWPDLYVASPIWTGWIELKKDDGALSVAQRLTLESLCERDVPGFVVRYTFPRAEDVEWHDGTLLERAWRGTGVERLQRLAALTARCRA